MEIGFSYGRWILRSVIRAPLMAFYVKIVALILFDYEMPPLVLWDEMMARYLMAGFLISLVTSDHTNAILVKKNERLR